MLYRFPADLSKDDLDVLCALAKLDPRDFSVGLLLEKYQVYEAGTILCLVAEIDKVLQVLAILQRGKPGSYMRALAQGLQELARSWQLKTVETDSFSPRVTRLLQQVGAKVNSVTLVMEV